VVRLQLLVANALITKHDLMWQFGWPWLSVRLAGSPRTLSAFTYLRIHSPYMERSVEGSAAHTK
jgi:hypothetical protein